jgi:hypothetical protein
LIGARIEIEHIASVAIAAGERPWVGYSPPLAIDGLPAGCLWRQAGFGGKSDHVVGP